MTKTQLVWIAELKKGNDLAAFNIYNDFVKAMYNTAIRITGSTEVAQDIVQDSFIAAFQKISALKDPMAFAGWLKQIVVNNAVQYIRRNKIQFASVTDHDNLQEDHVEEDRISDEELASAIRSLPEGCRTVLSLHLFEEMKHSEIAGVLSISESTSKTQYRHAKKLLKEKLKHHYED
ncbi:MAG: sigma-70 family RNA polymerase sigma factor [Bacteroidota bacterium]